MAKKITFEIDLDESGAVKSINKIDKSVKDVGDSAKKTEKSTKSFGKSLSNLAKGAGIIGLLSAAFEVLKEALGNNQKVMDALSTTTTALGVAFNDLFSFISNNVGTIINYWKALFDDPLGAIEDLGNAFNKYLISSFEQLVEAAGIAGDAISAFFSGDFAKAGELAAEAFKESADILTGVDGTVDKVVDGVNNLVDATVDYVTETYNAADAITQQSKNLAFLESQQTRIREQSDRDAERQRQIRDDETKGIDERIAANEELARILNEQEEREKQTVLDRIAALQNEQEQLGATQERRLEIFQLNTELAAIEAQQEGFRSEQLVNENALMREKLDLKGFQTQAELEGFEAQEAIRQKEIKDSENAIAQAKKESQAKIAQEKLVNNAKVNLAQGAAGLIGEFAEQDSKLGKAAAATQATIDTIQGAQSAFAQTPGGIILKSAAAAIAVGIGVANVKKILAIKPVNKNSVTPTGNTTSSAAPPAATVTPPQFSTAADTGTSQLAADINQQNEPVQAYVVSERVTNQQQLDRQVEINTQF